MGRGLSEQQREILAIAAAINAHRNGGEPQLAEFEIDVTKGTERPPIAMPIGGPWNVGPTDWRYVAARSQVDLFDDLLLVAVGGFRPGQRENRWIGSYVRKDPSNFRLRKRGIERTTTHKVSPCTRTIRWRWDPATVDHKRRVSINRAAESLLNRELLLFAPGPMYFCSVKEEYRPLCREIDREFDESGEISRGCYLTAEGLAAVGDRWQHLDAAELMEQWEIAKRVRRR